MVQGTNRHLRITLYHVGIGHYIPLFVIQESGAKSAAGLDGNDFFLTVLNDLFDRFWGSCG
ncbi:hypothetical protein D1872_328330 [compost metagenome]